MIFVKSLKLLVTLVLVVECQQTCHLINTPDGKIQRCYGEWICGDIKCPLDSDRCFIAATNEEEASQLARVNICISKRNTILSIKTSLTPTNPRYAIKHYHIKSDSRTSVGSEKEYDADLFKEDIKRSIQEALSNARKTGKLEKYIQGMELNNDYTTTIQSWDDLSKLESQSPNATPVAIQPCLVYPNPHIQIVKCEDKWICGDIECPRESDRCSLAVTNQNYWPWVQIGISCISKENVALKTSVSYAFDNSYKIISFYYNVYHNGGYKSSTSSIINMDEKTFSIEHKKNLQNELERLTAYQDMLNKKFDSAIEDIKRQKDISDEADYKSQLNNINITRSSTIGVLQKAIEDTQTQIKDIEEYIRNIN